MLRAGFLYVCGVYIKIWLYAASTFTIPSLCVCVCARCVIMSCYKTLSLCIRNTPTLEIIHSPSFVYVCAERAPFFTAHVLSSFEDNSMPWLITQKQQKELCFSPLACLCATLFGFQSTSKPWLIYPPMYPGSNRRPSKATIMFYATLEYNESCSLFQRNPSKSIILVFSFL